MFCFSFENTKPVSLLFGKKGQIGSDNRFSKKTELERSKFLVCKYLTKDLKLRKNNVHTVKLVYKAQLWVHQINRVRHLNKHLRLNPG